MSIRLQEVLRPPFRLSYLSFAMFADTVGLRVNMSTLATTTSEKQSDSDIGGHTLNEDGKTACEVCREPGQWNHHCYEQSISKHENTDPPPQVQLVSNWRI